MANYNQYIDGRIQNRETGRYLKHPSIYAYRNNICRCPACNALHAEATRRQRAAASQRRAQARRANGSRIGGRR